MVYDEVFTVDENQRVFAIEYLPGQYDQRADSASQCIQILTRGEKPACRTAKLIVLEGDISDAEYSKVKDYCINPVESRETTLDKPSTLETIIDTPEDIKVVDGFISMNDDELINLMKNMGLAMSFEDMVFCRDYFKDIEKRDPTVTEIKIIDTYWSDHCRHTTFLTEIEDIEINKSSNIYSPYSQPIKSALDDYMNSREFVYGDKYTKNIKEEKPVSLMDIATIAMKAKEKEYVK